MILKKILNLIGNKEDFYYYLCQVEEIENILVLSAKADNKKKKWIYRVKKIPFIINAVIREKEIVKEKWKKYVRNEGIWTISGGGGEQGITD